MEGICLCQVYRVPGSIREIVCIGLEYDGGEIKRALFYENGLKFYKNVSDVQRHLNEGKLVLHNPPFRK